jgi:hypothetical protein
MEAVMETIEQVKKAVDEGKLVKWVNNIYEVKYWPIPNQYVVVCIINQFATGLCDADVKDCYISEGNSSYKSKPYHIRGSGIA